MAAALYRVGRWAFRRRRVVVGAWLAAVLLALVAAAVAPSTEDEDLVMPGTESQQAFDLLDQRFPQDNAQGAQARLVFEAPAGEQITGTAQRSAVEETLDSLADGEQVAAVSDPFANGDVSADGTIAYAEITYDVAAIDLTGSSKHALEDAAEMARSADLTTEIGGDALDPEVALGGTTELVGLAVAAVVLVITLGSVVAAGLSLLTASAGVVLGFGAIAVLAKPLGLTSTVSILALMLGLAVGIDYALFITSRYRDERAAGSDPEEAAGRAVGRAGSAVVFAGATVVIALTGLSVVGIPELTKMGLGGAGAVLLAVLVALTLVPALLGSFGHRVLSRSTRQSRTAATDPAPPAAERATLATRWARTVLRRPVTVLLVAGLGLGILAVPTLALELGLPGDESKPVETTQRRAYDLMSDGFGPGSNGPLTVVVDLASSDAGAADRVADAVGGLDGVASVGRPMLNDAGDTAVLSVVPTTAPTSNETKELVQEMRDAFTAVEADTGADVFVTGRTALNIDISQAMSDALVPYLAIVVGLAVLLLLVVFRSVLVPVTAALGFLMSVGAAFGVLVAVCQWGWGADLIGMDQTGPIMSLMPILIIGVVFGLAMDYQVFLFTRVREAHLQGVEPREAIVHGFRHSGRVVAAAAVIMFSVFAGFVGVHSPTIQTMGIGLALAVAFDAFVVRMAVIPAVLALLGERAWWLPRILDRVLRAERTS